MPEHRIGPCHVRPIPGKLAKRDELTVEKYTDRPNPSIVARPSSDCERTRHGGPFARLFDCAEGRLVLPRR